MSFPNDFKDSKDFYFLIRVHIFIHLKYTDFNIERDLKPSNF